MGFAYGHPDTNGVMQTALLNLTIQQPRSPAIVRTDINHLVALCINMLSTAGVDKILRGES
jgi:hypothetical protein